MCPIYVLRVRAFENRRTAADDQEEDAQSARKLPAASTAAAAAAAAVPSLPNAVAAANDVPENQLQLPPVENDVIVSDTESAPMNE